MSPLYLRCGFCGRQQADGLLSRASWGHVSLTDGTNASACPSCKEQNSDWEQRLKTGGSSERYGATFGGSYQQA